MHEQMRHSLFQDSSFYQVHPHICVDDLEPTTLGCEFKHLFLRGFIFFFFHNQSLKYILISQTPLYSETNSAQTNCVQ